MPQLDIVTYIGQYVWALGGLFWLFFLIVLGILPKLQQQLALRVWAEEGLIEAEENKEFKGLDSSRGRLIEVFKNLCN